MNIPEPNYRILFGVTGDNSARFPPKIDYWAKFEGNFVPMRNALDGSYRDRHLILGSVSLNEPLAQTGRG